MFVFLAIEYFIRPITISFHLLWRVGIWFNTCLWAIRCDRIGWVCTQTCMNYVRVARHGFYMRLQNKVANLPGRWCLLSIRAPHPKKKSKWFPYLVQARYTNNNNSNWFRFIIICIFDYVNHENKIYFHSWRTNWINERGNIRNTFEASTHPHTKMDFWKRKKMIRI